MKLKKTIQVHLLFILLLSLSMLACNSESNINDNNVKTQKFSTGNMYNLDKIDIYKENILNNGDVESYNRLQIIYFDYSPGYFLFWDLIMANKFGYDYAFFNVYQTIFYGYIFSPKDYDLIDKKTKKLMEEYLNKAVELGVEIAKEEKEILKNKSYSSTELKTNYISIEYDTSNYNNEIQKYKGTSWYTNLLLESIVYSNLYNHPKAHFNVFDILLFSYVEGDINRFNEIDERTQKLMLEFLNRAVKLKVPNAKETYYKIENILLL